MESLKVQVMSKKLVKPSKPTPHNLQNLKLSLFDQLVSPSYVSIIFYYSTSNTNGDGNTGAATAAERRGRLEKSLSEVLTAFYPLAGRFIQNEASMDCSDQGVDYMEATVSKKLGDFLQDVPELELLNKLLPWDITPPATYLVTSPQLAIQINTFDCGGLAIGIRFSHIISDAWTMFRFMNLWAMTSRTGLNVQLLISSTSNYNSDYFSSIFPAIRSSSAPKSQLQPDQKSSTAKFVQRRFLFDETVIAKIKSRASSEGPLLNNYQPEPTKVVLAIAFLWKAITSVSLAKYGHLRDSALAIAVNLRGKVGFPKSEPQPPCGNFWMPVVVPFLAANYEAAGRTLELQDLIILVRDAIRERRSKILNASADDISSMLIDSRKELNEKHGLALANQLDLYIFTSWCKFPKYEADFGWGKPYWISGACGSIEWICLMDTKIGDGIEAWVSLKEKDMVLLELLLDF